MVYPSKEKMKKIGDFHNGNFLKCLELLANFDPFFADHVACFGGKGSGNVNCLSRTIFEELISLMGDYIRTIIVKEIREAGYFSVIVDSISSVAMLMCLPLLFFLFVMVYQ